MWTLKTVEAISWSALAAPAAGGGHERHLRLWTSWVSCRSAVFVSPSPCAAGTGMATPNDC